MEHYLADGTPLNQELDEVIVMDSEGETEFSGIVEDIDLDEGLVLVRVIDKEWTKRYPHLLQSNGLIWFDSSLVRPA